MTDPTAKKGRPTPTRKEQEAARKRPIVLDVKTDSKARRLRAREERAQVEMALRTGDAKHYPPEHQGPVRQYTRDFVDARGLVLQFLLPFTLVGLLVSFLTVAQEQIGRSFTIVFYAVVISAAVEATLAYRKMKALLAAKFGDKAKERALGLYFYARAAQPRRMRVPKPAVKRGEYPK